MSSGATRIAGRAILSVGVFVAASCGLGSAPPRASFLVVAGDSTYWVERIDNRLRMRGSPLLLARVNGAFSELYIADDDRSFRDALIVGQRIYRRDLVTGDSVLLREDSTIADITEAWLKANPDDVQLRPDEDTSEEPVTIATTETQLLDVVGPFVSYEYHLDVDVDGRKDQHLTRRGVIDVRTGLNVRVEDVAGLEAARRIYGESEAALVAALDSARNSTGERAERAQGTLDGFKFDSLSFELLESDRGVEVAFLVPGRGAEAAGYALPLPPLPLPAAAWMSDLQHTRPTFDGSVMQWVDSGYSIEATSDSLGDRAFMSVRRGERSWPVGLLPQPVRRVHRVDAPGDSLARRVLARAFDDAAGYSSDSRTASWSGKLNGEKQKAEIGRSSSCAQRTVARGTLNNRCRRSARTPQQTLHGKPNKNGTRNPPRI